MQEFGLIKSLPESLWLSEGQFFWAFPRAQSALFLISILSSFQGCWRWAACSGHDVIFVEAAGKCQLPVSRVHIFDHALGTFHAHCVPHSAGKAHSSSREDSIDRSLSVLLLDQALWAGKVSGPYLSYYPLGPGKYSLLLLLPISRVTLL